MGSAWFEEPVTSDDIDEHVFFEDENARQNKTFKRRIWLSNLGLSPLAKDRVLRYRFRWTSLERKASQERWRSHSWQSVWKERFNPLRPLISANVAPCLAGFEVGELFYDHVLVERKRLIT